MSYIHFMIIICFMLIVAFQIVSPWCALWVENNGKIARFAVLLDDLPPHQCKRPCFDPPDAGQTFSCTWHKKLFEFTCTMRVRPDGKEFVLTKGSVCPDLNGKAHTITDEDDVIGEVDCNGIGSANPNVIFLLMFMGGSFALLIILTDGGHFGGSGGIL